MPDVLKTLPIHSFRGIPFPVESRDVRFAHDITRHAIEYKRGKIVETTAGGNDVFRYRVPGREGLELVPAYQQWYTRYYSAFIAAIKDRSPGDLVDSMRGKVRVRPVTLLESSEATRRDGVDFDVEFEEDPEFEEIDLGFDSSVLGITSLSENLDREAALVAWEEEAPEQLTSKFIEYEEAEAPEPTINPIDALTGVLRKGEFAMQRPQAILNDTILRMEKLELAIEAQRDPNLYRLQLSTRRARLQTYRVRSDLQSQGGTVRNEVTREPMTLIEAANLYGLTVDEFIRLNPGLAKYPVVPIGTQLRYQRDGVQ